MRHGRCFTSSLGALLSVGAPAGAVGLGSAVILAASPGIADAAAATGGAVNTSHPTHVVGHGTAASCTSAAVVRDVAKGGIITFNCGPKPITIVMKATANVPKTRQLVVLDGGSLVTLSGAGKRRILYSDTCAGTWSTANCTDQPDPQIVLQNITLKDGYNGAQQPSCTANTPACWYGGVDGGGAVYVEGGQFKAVNSQFIDNRCYSYGPDLGGGAIRALAQYDNLPIDITNDTFRGGRCSNGGALSSISVQWDISGSRFIDNRAVGWGANPAGHGTPGGGSGGAIYLDGANDDATISGTTMTGNTAREGGGAVFDVVDTGWGALTFSDSRLQANTSGKFQTAPGIFYELDGTVKAPTLIDSTDR